MLSNKRVGGISGSIGSLCTDGHGGGGVVCVDGKVLKDPLVS